MIMLTEAQKAAKLEARQRFCIDTMALQAQTAPAPHPSVAGIGVAGNTLRVYLLEGCERDVGVPDTFGSLQTVIVRTSGFSAEPPTAHGAHRTRPIPCGVSVGHFAKKSAGILGCLVEANDRRCILSNNHVLANVNAATMGDAIVYPGPLDGGAAPADTVAHLTDFEPIAFSKGAVNVMDAAIAELEQPADVKPKIKGIGLPGKTPVSPSIGQLVAKCGRTTGVTSGTIVDVSFDGYVGFGSAGTAFFEDQIVASSTNGLFAKHGDSGSLIVEKSSRSAVALLFAGDTAKGMTLGNPISAVLGRFSAAVVGA